MAKIAIAQIEIVAGQPEVNAEKILQFVRRAKEKNVELIIFPELALSGKFVGENFRQKSFLDDCNYFAEKIIAASEGITIVFGNFAPLANQNPSRYFVAFGGEVKLTGGSDGILEMQYNQTFPLAIQIDSEPFSLGERKERDEFYCTTAKNLKRPLIYVNCVGIQNRGKTIYTFDGTSTVYNSRGEIVQVAESFAEDLMIVEVEEIDKLPALNKTAPEEVAEIYQAVSFGAEKFLRQIGVTKVVVGVSGGIDSAVAAALYTKILGAENVFLVNMPSKFNSATTKNLSAQLAKNLGCKYSVVPIQDSVDRTTEQLEGAGFKVSDFVKENIQARDRGSRILAAIAASVGGVFTCNANKAESTIGYATLYGDEAGFLSAQADLWKFQVYQLADYLNDEVFRREVIPQGIIEIVPSAELSNAQNVDEGKGDPLKYPYHDYLFRAFVEKKFTPENILQLYAEKNLEAEIGCAAGLVEEYFPTAKSFVEDLERWWKLYTGFAVAKRIQAPPILSVSHHAFGNFAESQNLPHFTQGYRKLKAEVLKDE